MNAFETFTWQAAAAGRWTARILGSLMVLFVLAFVVGGGTPPVLRLTAREQLYALGVACLFLGLVAAWFREGWGGLMSLLGWAFLGVLAKKLAWDPPFSIPAALGVVHILCWWRLRGPVPPPEAFSLSAIPFVRTVIWSLPAALGIFILLCANEIFGQPPLMSWPVRPPAGVVGTWRANLTTMSGQRLPEQIPVVFTIEADGSVSGTVGKAMLIGSRLMPNRSWLGRLLHWRTAHLIRGTLSEAVESYGGTGGDHFAAPLNIEGTELAGALFLSHPGDPKPLGIDLRKP